MGPDIDHVRAALARVRDPETGTDIVAAGRVAGLTVSGDRIGFTIEAPPGREQAYQAVRAAAEAAAKRAPGAGRVVAVLTAHSDAPRAAPPRKQAHAARSPEARPPRRAGGPQATPREPLPGVTHAVAVASGKGGVGKSTVAVNLACALAARGLAVGLMDADVYGPSVPIMTGLLGVEPEPGPDGRLVPPEAFGVKVMSMGFLVDPEAPMIWRGPIVASALAQLLRDVAWEPLDVLIIDMPPGTGDAQLTLVQRAPLSGAVIVSTPQEVALADVRRGVEMFRKTRVPILGIVENMSAFRDPEAGTAFAPFGRGGARLAADALGAPFLGEIPINPRISASGDAGAPPAADIADPAGGAFRALGEGVWRALESAENAKPPRIVFVD